MKIKTFFYFFALTFLCTSCEWWDAPMSTVNVVTPWGHAINYVYLITTIITGLVGLVVGGLMIYVIIRFREKPGDETIPKQVHGSFALELMWSIIPAILLIFIAVPTWQIIWEFDTGETKTEDPLVVEVVGHQWWWEFRYPDLDIQTAAEVHLPENREIKFIIDSVDVIHSFWIPRFGGKVDALPGQKNILVINTPPAAEEGGDFYQGHCVELCGLSHALMRMQAVVHKQDEWEQWVASHNTEPEIETSTEQAGQELMLTHGCIACHQIHGTSAMGVVGPNLTNFGNRRTVAAGIMENNRENLIKWIKKPEQIKPGSLMPNLDLPDEDANAIASYLLNSTVKNY